MGTFIRRDKREEILSQLKQNFPKPKLHFSGSTPPEIFVGRVNYPNVFSGILSPMTSGNTETYSSPEDWVSDNLSIEEVLKMRGSLVYGRQTTNIKASKSLNNVTQELALSSKSVSTEIFLKKMPEVSYKTSNVLSIMANPAPLKKAILEENPKVEKKVDYVVSDYDLKSVDALNELYNSKIKISHMQKLFSSGLLGMKKQRKLVPTRWGITAVDDILGKSILREVKNFPFLEEVRVFSDEYNGNKYKIILLPGEWTFEVIEAGIPEFYVPGLNLERIGFWRDYETFFDRKVYASSVTGAYYVNRLAVCEYLKKIKKQATVLFLREISQEYYVPLGVGILRELSRRAFTKDFQKAGGFSQALEKIEKEFTLPLEKYCEVSYIFNNYGKQKKLSDF